MSAARDFAYTACVGKIKHQTPSRARLSMRFVSRKAGKHGSLTGKTLALGVYHCPFCKMYHIGRSPK